MFQKNRVNLNGLAVPKMLYEIFAIITIISPILKPLVQHLMKPLKTTPEGGKGRGMGVDPLMVVVFAWTSFEGRLGVRI